MNPAQVADELEAIVNHPPDDRIWGPAALAQVLGDALDRYALARLHAVAHSRLRPPRLPKPGEPVRAGQVIGYSKWCPWCRSSFTEADFSSHLGVAHPDSQPVSR